LLDKIAQGVGARGGLLLNSRQDGASWVTSPAIEAHYLTFVAEGWHVRNDRIPRLVARGHAGFLTDTDVYSPEEIASDPMYTDYLTPLGFRTAAATIMPGLAGDGLVMSMEGFAAPESVYAGIPRLDLLRPHLARASMLSARLGLERARIAVAALEQVGAPAAMLGTGRRLLAANALFEAHMGSHWHDTVGGMRLADATADAKFGAVLNALRTGKGSGASLPMRHATKASRAVLHVLPMRGEGRDLFFNATAMAVIAVPGARAAPSVELIQGLLDLTPAEALLARAIAGGRTLAEAARDAGICPATARTHLKRIFAKSGVSRQAELVAMLGSVAMGAGGLIVSG
jgi:DNA-binding CsgD family transcriptional regulator